MWRQQASTLSSALGSYGRILDRATLAFDSSGHGTSLNTLRNRLLDVDAALLMLLDSSGEMLGVFTDFPWRLPHAKPFGTSRCFLFCVPGTPAEGSTIISHGTAGGDGFMYSKPTHVAFGTPSDSSGYGLSIDSSFSKATSGRSLTFDNPQLGTTRIVRAIALVWRKGGQQQHDLQFGTSGADSRSQARMLVGLANNRMIDRSWFG